MINDPFGMALPRGMTCSDCAHWTRCSWLLSREGQETICDWSPSRFKRTASCEPPPREPAEDALRNPSARRMESPHWWVVMMTEAWKVAQVQIGERVEERRGDIITAAIATHDTIQRLKRQKQAMLDMLTPEERELVERRLREDKP